MTVSSVCCPLLLSSGGRGLCYTAEGRIVPDRNDPSVYTLVIPGKESRQCALEFAPGDVSAVFMLQHVVTFHHHPFHLSKLFPLPIWCLCFHILYASFWFFKGGLL